MFSRTSAALALVVSGLLVIAPITATAAFADDGETGSTAATGTTTTDSTATDAGSGDAPPAESAPTEIAPVALAPTEVAPAEPATTDPPPASDAATQDPPADSADDIVDPSGPPNPDEGEPGTDDPPAEEQPSVPDDPTDVSVMNNTAGTGWTITWTAPLGVDVDDYTVTVTDEESEDSYVAADGTVTGTSFEADDLVDGDFYGITVASNHGDGEHGYSTIGERFASTALVPPSAPREVVAHKVSATTVEVAWDFPEEFGSSGLTGFDVTVFAHGIQLRSALRGALPPWIAGTAQVDRYSSSAEVELDREYVNTTLLVTVTATNENGLTGQPGYGFVTFGNPSPLAPQNTAAVVTGHHDASAHVTWTPPADNDASPITSYVVFYTFEGQQSSHESEELPADARSYDITGLAPGVAYQFHVIAFTDDGPGAASTVDPAATDPTPDIPAAPDFTALTAYPVSSGTVQLPASSAGQWVFGVAYSTPFALGWAQVAADGTVHWDLAAAKLPAGQHHILVIANDGSVLGAAAFAVSATARTALLATTGSDDSGLIGVAGLALGLGILLVVRRRGVRVLR